MTVHPSDNFNRARTGRNKSACACAFLEDKYEKSDNNRRIGNCNTDPALSEEVLVIPDGVTEIKDSTFFPITKLKSLTLSPSVTRIGTNAIKFFEENGTIRYNGTLQEWNAIQKSQKWFGDSRKFTVICSDESAEYGN